MWSVNKVVICPFFKSAVKDDDALTKESMKIRTDRKIESAVPTLC